VRNSGVGGRGARAPPKVDLVKIWAKSAEIWTKSLKIPAKMAPNVLSFEKNCAQHLQNPMKTFFWEVTTKTVMRK